MWPGSCAFSALRQPVTSPGRCFPWMGAFCCSGCTAAAGGSPSRACPISVHDMQNHVIELFSYTRWANDRIVDACRRLVASGTPLP